jgi:hypothetical protein
LVGPVFLTGSPLSPVQEDMRERVMAFLSGPLRRYVPGCEGATIRMKLNLSASPIPGSYAVEDPALLSCCGSWA